MTNLGSENVCLFQKQINHKDRDLFGVIQLLEALFYYSDPPSLSAFSKLLSVF